MKAKTVQFPDGKIVPAIGQGTWYMGERNSDIRSEVNALKQGLDAGMTLIDTAEMYADGGAERVVGEAIAGRRDDVFLVSKVYPHNAGGAKAITASEQSLKRLQTDYIDLYLLHWRGSIPLHDTSPRWKNYNNPARFAAGVSLIWILTTCRRCGKFPVANNV